MTSGLNIDPNITYDLSVYINRDDDSIKLREDICGQFYETVIRTKEAKTREALISLGWTPPNENKKEVK